MLPTLERCIFCGHGGSHYDMILNTRMKIIALTGTAFGVVKREGFYAVPRVWMIVRHYVILRWLIGQNRARPSQENVSRDGINIVMNQELPDPLLQIVLSFLD